MQKESGFSLIMLITVQGTMPRNSSIDVQHCTALTVSSLAFIQWSITAPSFCHLQQRRVGRIAHRDIFLDRRKRRLRSVVVVLHSRDASHHFAQVQCLDSNARPLQQLLRVSNRVERRRPRANRPEADVLQPLHYAANAWKTTPDLP